MHEGDSYIAAVSHLYRLKSIENTLATLGLEVITNALPTDKHHGWKHIEFDGEAASDPPWGPLSSPEPPSRAYCWTGTPEPA